MNKTQLTQLLKETDTPSYVFSVDEFEQRARLVKKYFGEKTGLCFSIKANPFLLGCLPEVFDKIEVCSPGELTVCEKTGADPATIIFSGVNKTPEDVERAMDDKVGTFTAESWLHAELINNSAVKRGIKVTVLVRVTGGSQFGMDEKDALDLISHRDEYEGIDIVGLHFFTGTQKRKPAAIEKELDFISAFADRVKEETGLEIKRIEYGTGLAVDYFMADADSSEEERLAAISDKVRAVAEKYELTVEMGRFFAAPCGYYFTKVMDVKTNAGINYAIVDGGMNHLKYDGQIQGMQIPVIEHIKSDECKESKTEKWTLCGSLCTTADVIARNATLKGLGIGDRLVFHRTGAYSLYEGFSLFLSRDLPSIYVLDRTGSLHLMRSRIETAGFNQPEDITEWH